MRCPFCDSGKLAVIKTENVLNAKIRRRNCGNCNKSFATIESILSREDRFRMKKAKLDQEIDPNTTTLS